MLTCSIFSFIGITESLQGITKIVSKNCKKDVILDRKEKLPV